MSNNQTTKVVMLLSPQTYADIRKAAGLSGTSVKEFMSAASVMSAQSVMNTAKLINNAKL
jgi:uncharacterized protein (DUF1778 family)